jgi:hypothetical protein
MAEEISYYAIVDDFSSRERPAGVLRRTKQQGATWDETFGKDLTWAHSSLLHSYERGDLTNTFIPITEEEAARIVERIRRSVAGAE